MLRFSIVFKNDSFVFGKSQRFYKQPILFWTFKKGIMIVLCMQYSSDFLLYVIKLTLNRPSILNDHHQQSVSLKFIPVIL